MARRVPVQDWSFLHYALPSAHLGRSPSALVARVDRYDTGSDLSKLTAPDSVVSVDSGVDPVALRPSNPAQRAGRGDQGRTTDGTTRAAARCRSRHLHGRRDAHRRQRPACQMRAISTVFSTHLVCHQTVVETGREHGARCDQREGGCTGGRLSLIHI